jgi:hypothetical protein
MRRPGCPHPGRRALLADLCGASLRWAGEGISPCVSGSGNTPSGSDFADSPSAALVMFAAIIASISSLRRCLARSGFVNGENRDGERINPASRAACEMSRSAGFLLNKR